MSRRFGSTTRVRVNGDRQFVDTAGLTIAKFRQTTSRADDPQIHTHAVISSKVSTADGRWWALDARYLKRKQRMIGGIYQSVLRAELAHRFGVGWEPIVNGQAEIAGTPPELVEVFSKRTGQVETALDGQGGRVPGPAGSRPDPLGARRVDPRSRRRHESPQVRQRCRRSAVTVARRGRRRSAGTRRRSPISCSPPAEPSPPRSPGRRWRRWWMCCRRQGRRGPGPR